MWGPLIQKIIEQTWPMVAQKVIEDTAKNPTVQRVWKSLTEEEKAEPKEAATSSAPAKRWDPSPAGEHSCPSCGAPRRRGTTCCFHCLDQTPLSHCPGGGSLSAPPPHVTPTRAEAYCPPPPAPCPACGKLRKRGTTSCMRCGDTTPLELC